MSEGGADDAAARADAAARLFSGRVEFLLSAPRLDVLPAPDVPEVAFCGRSNVGKSSLLNALTGRRGLARASVTPGRTQELIVFEVGAPTRFRLIDMPGYGFAKAPEALAARWRRLVRDYLRGRAVLRRALLLIDARHGVKPIDAETMALLDEAAVSYRLVLTKADKVKPSELARVLAATEAAARARTAAHPQVLATSAETKTGIAALRATVLADAGE